MCVCVCVCMCMSVCVKAGKAGMKVIGGENRPGLGEL